MTEVPATSRSDVLKASARDVAMLSKDLRITISDLRGGESGTHSDSQG